MLAMLTPAGLTLLFLAVVLGLATAFVWMLWEMEQIYRPKRVKTLAPDRRQRNPR
jgi:hypothetical protein